MLLFVLKRKLDKVLTFGTLPALTLPVNREDKNMHQACDNHELAEPKYFLLWVAVWILALAAFLPVLR